MRHEELQFKRLQQEFYAQSRVVADAEAVLAKAQSEFRKAQLAMEYAHIDDMIAQQKYAAAIYYYDAYKIQMTRAELAFFERKGYTPKNCKVFAGVQMEVPWPVTVAHDIDIGDGLCDVVKLRELLDKKEDFTVLIGMCEFDIVYDDDYSWDGEEERYHEFILVSGMRRHIIHSKRLDTSASADSIAMAMYTIMDKF
jgi:hypothetical protein